MNEFEAERPDPALIAELRAELGAVDPAIRTRVSERLARSMSQALVAAAAGGAAAKLSSGSSLWRALGTRPAGFVAGLAIGAACGAGAYRALRPTPPARIQYVAIAPTRPPEPAPAPATSSSTAIAATVPTPSARLTPHKAAPIHATATMNLAEQRALLDTARAAFMHGDAEATLRTLAEHSRRFPKSMLEEERAALEIKALAAAGRREQASVKAARFKAQFPQSVLLPSVLDSLNAIP